MIVFHVKQSTRYSISVKQVYLKEVYVKYQDIHNNHIVFNILNYVYMK